MTFKTEVTQTFEGLVCGECGISFAVPEWWVTTRKQNHETWYCPNGHPRHYPAKSEEEILREKLADRDRLLTVKNTVITDLFTKVDTLEASVKKTTKRAKQGMCPVVGCKRHFVNVNRHLQTKHPEWKCNK